MTRYGKDESDGLWSIKWMRWIMVDEMSGIDVCLWTQQRYSGGKMINSINTTEVEYTSKMAETVVTHNIE